MKFTNEKLNLETGLTKEWLITNGIGGYASSTIIGANTRKYHGLLIAPLSPPARRFLMLSKLDEALTIGEKEYNLYTNICKEYISDGYKYQQSFEKKVVPVFEYKVQNVKIEKIICMEYERNTVGVLYKVENKEKLPIRLTLAPVVNYRDFHTVNNGEFNIKQSVKGTKVKIILNNNSSTPLYMNISEGEYVEHQNDIFRNMFYTEEENRGFASCENHIVPGVYNVNVPAGKKIDVSFVFSLEENIENLDVKDLIKKETARITRLFKKSELVDYKKKKKTKKELEYDDEIEKYLIAADNFVVYRPMFKYHTIIAGYPWFLDWGRDTLISFEGLALIPKRFKEAKEILLTMVRDIKNGLVPNGYSGFDNRPLYNSVDASLLLFEQIQKYINYTGDIDFVEKKLYDKLVDVIESYIIGIDVDNNNIYLDVDNLIVSGRTDTQNTWMDAKCNGFAVTPRNGKAVEINALWYNALKIAEDLSNKFGNAELAKKYKNLARKTKLSFNEQFYNKRRKCLYDVLGDSKIRPNQLFSLSLTYPIIDPKSEMAKNILNVVEKKLLNNYGLKSLASTEEGYVEVYEGGEYKRDSSYHQGITWTWLLGLYYDTLKNMKKAIKTKTGQKEINEKLEKLVKNTRKTFKKEIEENGCIGSIAEIYDSKKPQLPRGTIAQAWSVSEVLRIILER